MDKYFLRKSNNLNEQISELFLNMTRQFGRTKTLQLALYYDMCYTYGKELVDRILEEQNCSIDEIENYITKIEDKYAYYDLGSLSPKELSDEWNKLRGQPSIDDQITSLKSQVKYCKNPLQKLNMEREMNSLIRERNRK